MLGSSAKSHPIKSSDESNQSETSKEQDFDLEKPVDKTYGIERLNGNEKMFFCMLRRLETLTLNANIAKVAKTLNNEDLQGLEAIMIVLM